MENTGSFNLAVALYVSFCDPQSIDPNQQHKVARKDALVIARPLLTNLSGPSTRRAVLVHFLVEAPHPFACGVWIHSSLDARCQRYADCNQIKGMNPHSFSRGYMGGQPTTNLDRLAHNGNGRASVSGNYFTTPVKDERDGRHNVDSSRNIAPSGSSVPPTGKRGSRACVACTFPSVLRSKNH